MVAARSDGPAPRLASAVANLFPGYFALVMATGIVSIAARLLGFDWVALSLFAIGVAAYVVLGLLLVARVVFYPRRVLDDFRDHGRGAGFFTVVAATCVLGTQSIVVGGQPAVA